MAVSHDDGALRVLLQFLRAREADAPYAFRFEPQDYILPTLGGESPTARFDWTQDMLADLQAVRMPGRDPAVAQRLGEKLRSFVKDANWAPQEREIDQALAEHRPIFLTIRSSAAELYALPWELLTLKSGQFIGEVDGLLVRFEWPESKSAQERPKPRPEGGRILVAWSAAGGAVPYAEHLAAIATACAAGFHPFNPDTDVIPHASLGRIAKTLEEAQQAGPPIAILHLLCHGGTAGSSFGLLLDGEDGPVVVDAAQLRQQLAPFASMVRLVVLSACDSGNIGALGNQLGSVAQALHRCGYQSVIASRVPLSVVGSIALTKILYGEMLSGPTSLETALLAARKYLLRSETNLPREERHLDWASVQLYAQHDSGDDTRPVVFRPFRGLLAFQPEHRRFFFGRDKEVEKVLTKSRSPMIRLSTPGCASRWPSLGIRLPRAAAPGFERVLKELVSARLLVQDGVGQASTVEVAHESLIRKWPRLRAWLDEDRAGLLVQRRVKQAAQQWALQNRDESLLYRGTQLAQAGEWRKTWEARLGDLDRSFLDASEALRVTVAKQYAEQLGRERTRARQTRIAAVVLGVFFLGAAAAFVQAYRSSVLANQKSVEAKQKSDEAHDGLLVTIAQIRKDDPTLVATILREVEHPDFALWAQAAADTLQNGVAEAVLRGPEVLVLSVAFSRDGKKIITGSRDATARIWNADGSGTPLILAGHKSSVSSVGFSPDGKKVITGSYDQTVRIWNANGAGAPLVLEVYQDVLSVAFSPDGKKIVTGCLDETVRIWNADGSGLPLELTGHARFINSVAFSTDGKKIATGSADETVRIWNADGSGEPLELKGHEGAVRSVAFSPDGKRLVSGSSDETARIWNADGSGVLLVLKGLGNVSSVAFSPDGKRIVTGSGDKTARVCSADGVGAALVLKGHADSVTSVAFSLDGNKIVTGSYDGTARIWNANGSGASRVFTGHQSSISAVAFSSDGLKVATGSKDKTARLWNADGSGAPLVLTGHESGVASVAFSPDGTKIATGSADETVRIWKTDGSGAPLVLTGHEGPINSVAFSPDGGKLVTGSLDKTARIWKADGSGGPDSTQGSYGLCRGGLLQSQWKDDRYWLPRQDRAHLERRRLRSSFRSQRSR